MFFIFPKKERQIGNSSVTNIINLLYKRLERLKDVQIKKNIVIPQKIPPEGIIILRSGKCEIVETILSPVSYVLELRPELEVLVQDMDDDNRHNQMSKIIKKVSDCLKSDFSLGGNVDYLHTEPPEYSDENIDGAPPVMVASVPIIIEFVSNNPLL